MEKLVQQTYQLLSHVARATWWSKNWLLKLLSLGLGLSLWYFVTGADQVDRTITMPIELVNLPANLVIANPSFKQEIEVSLRGPRSLVQAVRDQQLSRRVDLSKAQPGPFTIHNSAETVSLPRGLAVVRLQPTYIVLQLDRMHQKQLPIHPVTEGVLAPGYALRHISLTPDHIGVSGPKTLLDTFSALQTRAIDINGLQETARRQIPVTIPAELLALIGETVVNATVEVGLHMQQLRVDNIPVETIPPDADLRFQPKTVTVEALIPVKLVLGKKKPTHLFRAVVTLPENSTTESLPVTVQPRVFDMDSKEIKVLDVNPPQVQVVPGQQQASSPVGGQAAKAAAPQEQPGKNGKAPAAEQNAPAKKLPAGKKEK